MDTELLIRNRTLKIINSRTRFPLKDGYLCEKDLKKELHLTDNDLRVIITQLEKFFNILCEDDEIDSIHTVNDLVRIVQEKPNGRRRIPPKREQMKFHMKTL
jgi:acyl carrier protein